MQTKFGKWIPNRRNKWRIHIKSSWFQTFAVFRMLYAFFWVIPRRLNFIRRRFGTLFHLHGEVPAYEDGTVFRNVSIYNYDAWELPRRKLPAHEYGTESSETSAYKIQTPGNYPEESYLPMKMEQCVPKRQHIQFRRRGITQKKATCLWRWNREFRNVGI